MDIPEPCRRLARDEPRSLKELSEPKSLKPPSGIRVSKRRKRTWGWFIRMLIIGLVLTGAGLAVFIDHEYYRSWHADFTVLPKEATPWKWQLSKYSVLKINGTVSGGNGGYQNLCCRRWDW